MAERVIKAALLGFGTVGGGVYKVLKMQQEEMVSKLGARVELDVYKRQMLGFTNPHPDVIRRYREMGGELITVGSDGHVPEYLGYGFDRLPELLFDCGFDSYTVFRKGKPEFRKVLVKI